MILKYWGKNGSATIVRRYSTILMASLVVGEGHFLGLSQYEKWLHSLGSGACADHGKLPGNVNPVAKSIGAHCGLEVLNYRISTPWGTPQWLPALSHRLHRL